MEIKTVGYSYDDMDNRTGRIYVNGVEIGHVSQEEATWAGVDALKRVANGLAKLAGIQLENVDAPFEEEDDEEWLLQWRFFNGNPDSNSV
jgi:hypothetical protein